MELAIRPMIHTEARECVDKIKSNMTNVRHLILDLYERDGWSALGYESWRECVTAEFKQGQAYLYRQLEAAQTERNISTIIENANNIPEAQLQPLTKLRDDPEAQREAWQQAVDTAPEGKVTAAIVAKVVKEMTAEKSKPEAKEKEVTEAKNIITFVISHLERIRANDPKREEQFIRLENWINKNREGRKTK